MEALAVDIPLPRLVSCQPVVSKGRCFAFARSASRQSRKWAALPSSRVHYGAGLAICTSKPVVVTKGLGAAFVAQQEKARKAKGGKSKAKAKQPTNGEEKPIVLGTAWPMLSPKPKVQPSERDDEVVRQILKEIAESDTGGNSEEDRQSMQGDEGASAASTSGRTSESDSESVGSLIPDDVPKEVREFLQIGRVPKAKADDKLTEKVNMDDISPLDLNPDKDDRPPRTLQRGGSDWPRRKPAAEPGGVGPGQGSNILRFPWDPQYQRPATSALPSEETIYEVDPETGAQIPRTVVRGPVKDTVGPRILEEESEYEPEEFWDPYRFEGGIEAVKKWDKEREAAPPAEAGFLDSIVQEARTRPQPRPSEPRAGGRFGIDLEYEVDPQTGEFVQVVKQSGSAVDEVARVGEAAMRDIEKKWEEDAWNVKDLQEAKSLVTALVNAGDRVEELITRAGREGKLTKTVLYILNNRRSAALQQRGNSSAAEGMELLCRRVAAEMERLNASPALRFLDELLCMDDGSSEADWLRACKIRMRETFVSESYINIFNPPGVPRPLPDGTFGVADEEEMEDEGILRIDFIREVDDILEAVELEKKRVEALESAGSRNVAAKLAVEKKLAIATQLRQLRRTAALLKI